jgi:protein disulfide-isomerase
MLNRLMSCIAIAALLASAPMSFAASEGWLESYADAMKLSKKTGKPVLANFTGSDWCQYCIKLHDEVFETAAFKQWAPRHVVLLEIDYPRAKRQSKQVKEQNAQLKQKYTQVTGYPSVLFLDSAGEVLGKTGYFAGGPEKWIKNAHIFLDKAPKAEPAAADTAEEAPAAPATAEGGFTGAVAQAKSSGRPLVAVIVHTTSDYVQKKADELLADDEFAALASSRVTVVSVNTLGKDKDQAEAIAAFRKQHKLATTPTHIFAFDAVNEKVLYQTGALIPGGILVKRLNAVLPADASASASANGAAQKASNGAAAKADAKETPAGLNGEWTEDYDKALAYAKAMRRPVILDFTGSDWCGWCIKLDNEVFKQDEFKKFASEKLVLVKLDFPRRTPQDEKIKAQNQKLAQQYSIRGYPTLVILNAAGRKVGEMGYVQGGPKPFLEELQKVAR